MHFGVNGDDASLDMSASGRDDTPRKALALA